jgi:hypothetical protein
LTQNDLCVEPEMRKEMPDEGISFFLAYPLYCCFRTGFLENISPGEPEKNQGMTCAAPPPDSAASPTQNRRLAISPSLWPFPGMSDIKGSVKNLSHFFG